MRDTMMLPPDRIQGLHADQVASCARLPTHFVSPRSANALAPAGRFNLAANQSIFRNSDLYPATGLAIQADRPGPETHLDRFGATPL